MHVTNDEAMAFGRSLLDHMIEESRSRLSPESFAQLRDEAAILVAQFEAVSVGARRDAILIATAMLQLSVAEDGLDPAPEGPYPAG